MSGCANGVAARGITKITFLLAMLDAHLLPPRISNMTDNLQKEPTDDSFVCLSHRRSPPDTPTGVVGSPLFHSADLLRLSTDSAGDPGKTAEGPPAVFIPLGAINCAPCEYYIRCCIPSGLIRTYWKIRTTISLKRGNTASDLWLSVSDVVDEANLHGRIACQSFAANHPSFHNGYYLAVAVMDLHMSIRLESADLNMESEIISPTTAHRCCSTYTDSVESATLPRFYEHV